MRKFFRPLWVSLGVLALGLVVALPAFASPISVTAYSSVVTDLIDGIGGALPALVLSVLGIAGGLLLIRVVWGTVKRFLGR
jgi:hypothetical protein